jgi:hypothetical protein
MRPPRVSIDGSPCERSTIGLRIDFENLGDLEANFFHRIHAQLLQDKDLLAAAPVGLVPFARGSQSAVEEFGSGAVGVYAQAQWTSRPPRAGKLSRRLRGQLSLFDFARRSPGRASFG